MSIEENMEWMGLKKAQKQLKMAMENIDEAEEWLWDFPYDDPLHPYSVYLQDLWRGLSINTRYLNALINDIERTWEERERNA